jgi:hypothetical protein
VPVVLFVELLFPAAMQPGVLVGVAADPGLERGGEPLSEQPDVVGGAAEPARRDVALRS